MVDTSKYYKDWDAQLTLGNIIEYHLENNNGDNIIFMFRIYNHGLAIEWIQRFYKISTQKSNYFPNLTIKNGNRIENFGFETSETIFVFSENYRCFDDGLIEGCYLELKNFESLNLRSATTNTNPIFRFNKNVTKNQYSQFHFDITQQWNILDQDKDLSKPLNDTEKNNLINGKCRVGFLSAIKLNGNFVNELSFDLSDAKIKKIEFTLSS